MKHCYRHCCFHGHNYGKNKGCTHELYCASVDGQIEQSREITRMGPWQKEEDAVLAEHQPEWNKIAVMTGRTYQSVLSRARLLGYYEPATRKHIWSSVEIDYLRDNYHEMTVKDIARNLGLNKNVVNTQVRKMQMRKNDR